jgi:hypothetical protein
VGTDSFLTPLTLLQVNRFSNNEDIAGHSRDNGQIALQSLLQYPHENLYMLGSVIAHFGHYTNLSVRAVKSDFKNGLVVI